MKWKLLWLLISIAFGCVSLNPETYYATVDFTVDPASIADQAIYEQDRHECAKKGLERANHLETEMFMSQGTGQESNYNTPRDVIEKCLLDKGYQVKGKGLGTN